MPSFAGAIRGANLHFAKKEKKEQQERGQKRQDQLFKFALDKSKREQAVFNRQQQFVDLVVNSIKGIDTVGAPEILAGGPRGVGEDGLPVLRKADGVPTPAVAPVSADAGQQNFQKLLSDPAFLFAAKQAGIDLTPISRLQVQQESLEERRFAGEERRELTRGGQEITVRGQDLEQARFLDQLIPIKQADGSVVQVRRRDLLSGKAGGIQTTAPQFLTTSELESLRDPATNQLFPFGTTKAEAARRGAIPLSAAKRALELSFKASLEIVGKLDRLVDEIFTAESPLMRLLKAPGANFQVITQSNPKAVEFNALRNGILANIIRAFGEKGTLTDGDIARASALLPKFTPVPDRRSVAKGKLKQIRELMNSIANRNPKTFEPKKGERVVTPGNIALDAETAKEILEQAGGDKEKARIIAREMGFVF